MRIIAKEIIFKTQSRDLKEIISEIHSHDDDVPFQADSVLQVLTGLKGYSSLDTAIIYFLKNSRQWNTPRGKILKKELKAKLGTKTKCDEIV